jgi:hypothetical protein
MQAATIPSQMLDNFTDIGNTSYSATPQVPGHGTWQTFDQGDSQVAGHSSVAYPAFSAPCMMAATFPGWQFPAAAFVPLAIPSWQWSPPCAVRCGSSSSYFSPQVGSFDTGSLQHNVHEAFDRSHHELEGLVLERLNEAYPSRLDEYDWQDDYDFGEFRRHEDDSDSGYSDSGTDVSHSDDGNDSDESIGDLSIDCPEATCAEGCTVFCSICLDDCTSGQQMRTVAVCGHQFHAECLESWLLRRARCPNCRRSVSGHIFSD